MSGRGYDIIISFNDPGCYAQDLEVIVLFKEVIQHVVSIELLGQLKRSHDEHITLLTGMLTDMFWIRRSKSLMAIAIESLTSLRYQVKQYPGGRRGCKGTKGPQGIGGLSWVFRCFFKWSFRPNGFEQPGTERRVIIKLQQKKHKMFYLDSGKASLRCGFSCALSTLHSL